MAQPTTINQGADSDSNVLILHALTRRRLGISFDVHLIDQQVCLVAEPLCETRMYRSPSLLSDGNGFVVKFFRLGKLLLEFEDTTRHEYDTYAEKKMEK